MKKEIDTHVYFNRKMRVSCGADTVQIAFYEKKRVTDLFKLAIPSFDQFIEITLEGDDQINDLTFEH